MPRNLITPTEFRAQADPSGATVWRSSSTAPETRDGRVIRYTFSDPSVARDGNTIAADAWVLTPFLTNPVFLWAHDADQPPIGRVTEIGTSGSSLIGDVEYIDRDIYPFADTIYQMVRAGFLNATSVGFMPLKWSFPTDKNRMGGVDFKRVELLEISQVPVPALPTALVEARRAGIDTAPIFDWAGKVLDRGDVILIPRAELEAMRSAAKMPKPNKTPTVRRGLFEVADLAYLLMQLGWLEDSVEWEAAMEGDGSDIPRRLTDALRMLGQILVDMTVEEVAEMVAEEAADETGGDVTMGDTIDMAAPRRAVLSLALIGRLLKSPVTRATVELNVVPNKATQGILDALARAGRVLSSENETSLRQAASLISAVLDQVAVEQTDPLPEIITQTADIERERAAVRARVHRLRSAA